MFSKSFRIVQPKRFEKFFEQISIEHNEILVNVSALSICKADLRYYLGKREERVLGKKYPMSLIHEAVGTIVKSSNAEYQIGSKVVLLPNCIRNCDSASCTHKVCLDNKLGENYCDKAVFASSNFDGFSKEFVSISTNNVIVFPEELDNEIAVFSELVSVANAAVRRISFEKDSKVAIWGDGILAYILHLVLAYNGVEDILVYGKHDEKLSQFNYARTFNICESDMRENGVTVVFECVGGNGAEAAIDDALGSIIPGGQIVLTGVAEKNPKINTRKVLEKGISLHGVTRSNYNDFETAVSLLTDKRFQCDIRSLIIRRHRVTSINEYYEAFEFEASNRMFGKQVIDFRI